MSVTYVQNANDLTDASTRASDLSRRGLGCTYSDRSGSKSDLSKKSQPTIKKLYDLQRTPDNKNMDTKKKAVKVI